MSDASPVDSHHASKAERVRAALGRRSYDAQASNTSRRNLSGALDATDFRLLDLLQTDCSLTNQALAERANISPATCIRRVRHLIDLGIIERQIAIVAPTAFGPRLTAFVEITLDRQDSESIDAFEKRVTADAAVQQCYRVSPGPDFVLVIQVEHMLAYHALVHRLFTSEANVRNVRSFFSINRSKFEPRVT
ncbi:Lrp/AsnC family transcriptional regulator [soil metagenome]